MLASNDILLCLLLLLAGLLLLVYFGRRADGSLLSEARRRKALMDVSRDGIVILDEEHRIVEANKRFADMLGYTPEEVLSLRTWDFDDTMSEEEIRSSFTDFATVRATFETRHRRKDGSTYDVEVSIAGATFDDKPIVITIARDISDRKRVEEDLREVQRMSGLGSWTWDVATGEVAWSEEVYRIFGLAPQSFTPHIDSILALSAPWPEDQARGQELVRRAVASREKGHYDQRFLRPDGSVGHYHSTFQGEYDDRGELVRIKGSVLDVTERKQAVEQAEAASRAKSEFLANMSHELRTPLNGLMGMLQVLGMTRVDEEQKAFIDNALQASRRLTHLLGDILDLSRIEAGKVRIAAEPFDFCDVMDAIVQLFELSAVEKGLELRTELDPGIPCTLIGDPTRLQQVLTNLVGNALKFTNAGHVAISAHSLRPLRDGETRILFSVADTGIGIADEDLGALFTPFTQVEVNYTRAFQGAGLGLSITKRLVTLMGGTLAVESEPGVGSVMHFCLPFRQGASRATEPPDAEERAVLPPLNVLIAEDDAISAVTAGGLLGKMGHASRTVEDGREVLDVLKTGSFDLVLMDVQMPLLDGVEATHAIRRGEAGRENSAIPIVAMTAYAMEGDRERFLAEGMDGYMAKPIDVAMLGTALDLAWKRKKGEPESGD